MHSTATRIDLLGGIKHDKSSGRDGWGGGGGGREERDALHLMEVPLCGRESGAVKNTP